MRKAEVKMYEQSAGYIWQDEEGYHFQYITDYLQSSHSEPVSATLPLQSNAFHSSTIFPFFDGLIPEGWLLDIAEKTWKLSSRDRMGLLLACCRDCIGAVSIQALPQEEDAL